jgi:hypothetical protein
MPSLSHEALLLLFRNRPELAPELLRDALHVTLPPYSNVRLESADLTDVSPAEYRADLVVLLVDATPVLGQSTSPAFAHASSVPHASWSSHRATPWPIGAARPSTWARAPRCLPWSSAQPRCL